MNQNTVRDIAEKLNSLDITWGVGGSYLLMIYELIKEPNDLDLWISPNDMRKIRSYFSNYIEIPTEVLLPPELHYKILYRDIEVDFVACFKVKPNQYDFEYNINPNNIKKIKTISGIELPCTYLEDWYIVYKLLKRDDKANLIKQFFKKNKMSFFIDVIQNNINNKNSRLPRYITEDVNNLIYDMSQLSLSDYQTMIYQRI